jgi:hypothetical protein
MQANCFHSREGQPTALGGGSWPLYQLTCEVDSSSATESVTRYETGALWELCSAQRDFWLTVAERKAECMGLSTTNKLLVYKTILKPIWTYDIQLWGTAFHLKH